MRLTILTFILLAVLAGCGGGGSVAPPPPPPPAATVTSVSASPANVSVEVGTTRQFSATVQGTGNFNPAVTWLVNGSVGGSATFGTITSAGLYTAPSLIPAAPTVTITAQSVADPSKSGTAAARVTRAAPSGAWQRNGPEGAIIFALATDLASPNIIYAGSLHGGIWKSTDSGLNWLLLTANHNVLNRANISDIEIDSASGTIYAATNNFSSVYKSADGGASWVESRLPTQNLVIVLDIEVDPQNNSVVYAVTHAEGIYKSTDAGASWSRLTAAPFPNAGKYIRIDPASTLRLYLGTDAGLFVSTDGGNAWAQSSSGIASVHAEMVTMEVDLLNPARIYLQTKRPGLTVGGFYRSIDRGATWIQLIPDIDGRAIATSPANSDVVYLALLGPQALLKSVDAGQTWNPSGQGLPAVGRTLITLSSQPDVLIGQWAGDLWRSTDGGQTWSTSSTGMAGLLGFAVGVDPSNPATVYFAGNGIHQSTDRGATWALARNGDYSAIAVDPFDSQHIVVGSVADPLGQLDFSVIESRDSGATWTGTSVPAGSFGMVRQLVFHPSIFGTIFVATSTSGVLRSQDGGATYATSNVGLSATHVNALAIPSGDPGVVYAGTGGQGVFKSSDGGNSWQATNAGIPPGAIICSFAIDDQISPATVYAGGFGQLYKSMDAANSWQTVDLSALGITSQSGCVTVVVDPSSQDSLFVMSFGGMAGWSPDGGATWRRIDSGLGAAFFSDVGGSAAISKLSPQILYVASPNGSVLSLVIGP